MSSSFYNVYIGGGFDANSKKSLMSGLKKQSIARVRCVKHGFSWINAVPYFNAASAILNRCYFSSFTMLCFSFLQMNTMKAMRTFFPGAGLDIVVFLALASISGLYFHAMIEREVIYRGNVLAGTYLAGNKDEAVRSFFNLMANS